MGPKPVLTCADAVDAAIAAAIRVRYQEPQRAYHDLTHIESLLRWQVQYQEKVVRPDLVRWSIWLHDAVYDPRRTDNEEKSARLAVELLTNCEVPPAEITVVERQILSTKRHRWEDGHSDTAYFLDFDLAILGALPDVYEVYAKAVRQEYSWVPEPDYRRERAAVLGRFLNRDRLYFTDDFLRTHEQQARHNLSTEMAQLLV